MLSFLLAIPTKAVDAGVVYEVYGALERSTEKHEERMVGKHEKLSETSWPIQLSRVFPQVVSHNFVLIRELWLQTLKCNNVDRCFFLIYGLFQSHC